MDSSFQNPRRLRQLTHHLAYTPYGFVRLSNYPPLVGFAGQWREVTTGLYPLGMGCRTYSPLIMRFISPDRLSPFDKGGFNAYAYCGGDPVNFSDPSAQSRLKISASGAGKRLGLIRKTGHSKLLNDAGYPQSMKPFIKQLDEHRRGGKTVNALLFRYEGDVAVSHRLYGSTDGLMLQPVESSILKAYRPSLYAEKGDVGLGVIDGPMPMDVKGYLYIEDWSDRPPSYAELFPDYWDLPPDYNSVVSAIRGSKK